MAVSTDIRRALSQMVHSDWRCWLLRNFFTNNEINNFEVSYLHRSNQKLVYSPNGCAKFLLTWQIAWNYLHGLITPEHHRQGKNIVCRLNKFLYGLKHASRDMVPRQTTLYSQEKITHHLVSFWFMWTIFFWREMIWHKCSVLKTVYYDDFTWKILET